MSFTQTSSLYNFEDTFTSWPLLHRYQYRREKQEETVATANENLQGISQEPVPFEDFKINFGINPDILATPSSLAIDLALAQPPQQPPSITSSSAATEASFIDSFLFQGQRTLLDFPASTSNSNNTTSSMLPFPLPTALIQPSQDISAASVLDDNEQKAFSSFLDAFFMDPDTQLIENNNNNNFTAATLSNDDSYNSLNSNINQQIFDENEQEELRRNSILQSLDDQKKLHQKLNLIASLPQLSSSKYNTLTLSPSPTSHSTTLNDLLIKATPTSNNTASLTADESCQQKAKATTTASSNVPESIFLKRSEYLTPPYTSFYSTPPPPSSQEQQQQMFSSPIVIEAPSSTTTSNISSSSNKKKRHSVASNQNLEEDEAEPLNHNNSTNECKKAKRSRTTYRELLTEEEKRANHIASEQKRRTAIRNGFKDLTELVPTLKNVNNSKSNVLFKAVEFIRHLENRNSSLREKIRSLELRDEAANRLSHLQDRQLPSFNPTNTAAVAVGTSKRTRDDDNDEVAEKSATTAISPSNMNGKTNKTLHPQKQRRLSNSPTIISRISNSNSSTYTDTHHTQDNLTRSYSYQQPYTTTSPTMANAPTLPLSARNALLAHKKQEKQLLLLQEQLQLHQRLIAEREEQKERSIHRHLAAAAKAAIGQQLHETPVHIKAEPQ
ncbi:hypothetical protein BDF20DRAFT_833741 [Mycotypha africana]|uniref:uncharacterized protein n=1 Tax=Mycotypha africana TaxID=64632 RepID=UPI002300759A|nr:uncharacterized protein BDF20DRAFT_833741 [Mycotypha africana]KAI8984211.1 hypothetical protein BDF20DRAFT_833741 [Mycotypha africana]